MTDVATSFVRGKGGSEKGINSAVLCGETQSGFLPARLEAAGVCRGFLGGHLLSINTTCMMARKSWAREADGCGTASQNASQRCQTVPQGVGRRDALLALALWGLQFLSLAPLKRTSNPVCQLPGPVCWAQRQVISRRVVHRKVLGVMVMLWQCHSRGWGVPLPAPWGWGASLCCVLIQHSTLLLWHFAAPTAIAAFLFCFMLKQGRYLNIYYR